MTELERLKYRLFEDSNGLKVKNISIFPGSIDNPQAEEITKALNSILDDIESGNIEIVEEYDD